MGLQNPGLQAFWVILGQFGECSRNVSQYVAIASMDPRLLSKKHLNLKAWSQHSIQETGTPILKILAQLRVYVETDTG